MLSDYLSTVDWSRAQFAMTAIYHWLFVPLTLGLGFLIAIMETLYVRTKDPFWLRTTKFWMRLFGINFAIGVATGLILEFEFGTNWSNYSHFVGDIFGAPLAIEGILAFFLESTFIAVMFFGWRKVSRGFHLTATWLTAFGANLSAWWILVANSWMQYPVGCDFNLETVRNEMTSFSAVALSPVAVNKFFHTVTSSFVLAALFVVGVSAWYLLRRREQLMARRSIAIASAFGFVFALVTIIRKLMNPAMQAGWASTISLILLMGGVIVLLIGLVGEYIGRIYLSINRYPQFVVRRVMHGGEEEKHEDDARSLGA